ncbi:MAG: sensor domain-containing protein [Acidimicrobiales bacterium]
MADMVSPLGEWADGTRTLLVCPAAEVASLARLSGIQADQMAVADDLPLGLAAVCTERFTAVLVALPLSGREMARAVGELRLVRQGPAIVVVGAPEDQEAVLSCGANGFVPRTVLTAARLRRELRLATGQRARLMRLVEHVLHGRRIVDSLLEGLIVCSPAGRILYANASAAEILGMDLDELLFAPLPIDELELAYEDGSPVTREELASAQALRAARPVESVIRRLRRPDGAVRWVEVFVSLLSRRPGQAPYAVLSCFRDVTDERDAHGALLAAERRRRLLLEHAADGYLVLDADFRVTEASPSAGRLWPGATVVGSDAGRLVHPADEEWFRRTLADACAGSSPGRHIEVRIADGCGVERWIEATVTCRLGEPEIAGVVLNVSDVTERKSAETARRFAEERFRLGFEHGTAGMTITDLEGRVVEVNPALCELLGKPADGLVGTQIAEWVHEDDRADRQERRRRLFAGEIDRYRAERRYVRSDGTTVWCLLNVALIRDGERRPLYLFSQFQDITERKSNEAALEHRVVHDVLTGLPNRRGLKLQLDGALERAAVDGGQVAVLFLDIDRFKVVNDGLGHVAGDKILVEIARRLASGMRTGDAVARFGGDEFIVVCEHVESLEEAGALATRISGLFEAPFDVDGKPLFVTASCGIVLIGAETTAEDALRDADAAMYEAKERGRGRLQVFDERLRRAASERLEIDQALRVALDRQEMWVAYQPVVAVDGCRTVGVEALARWDHPQRGTLDAADFIPAAEASGLIVRLGSFVLAEALDRVVHWRAELPGCSDLWVGVNVSPRQLSFGNPVAACERALAESGAPPSALRLELTESGLMEDVDASVRMLEELRSLGVLVAIDDFGTGHSSLAYLSRLPVSLLKIDRSFVAGIGSDPNAPEIVRTITSLARAMRLETCAEGVERPDQLVVVERTGCELAQGHLWAPALRPDELEAFVADRQILVPTAAGGHAVRRAG